MKPLVALFVGATLVVSCGDQRRLVAGGEASVREDLDDAVRAEPHRFRRCARLVGDHYRSVGHADVRVDLEMHVDIEAATGRAVVRSLRLELPDDLPADVERNARACYEELFPRTFSTVAEYRGPLTYPLCVSVMPEPPNG